MINHSENEFVFDFAYLQPSSPAAKVRARDDLVAAAHQAAACSRCRRTCSATRSASAPSSSAATSRRCTSRARRRRRRGIRGSRRRRRAARTPRRAGLARLRAPWPMGAPATTGMPRPPSRSASTVVGVGRAAVLLDAADEVAEDDAGHAVERAREPELRELAVDAIRAARRPPRGTARRRRAASAHGVPTSRESSSRLPPTSGPSARPRSSARKPVSGGGGVGDSTQREQRRRVVGGERPSCVTTGACSDVDAGARRPTRAARSRRRSRR